MRKDDAAFLNEGEWNGLVDSLIDLTYRGKNLMPLHADALVQSMLPMLEMIVTRHRIEAGTIAVKHLIGVGLVDMPVEERRNLFTCRHCGESLLHSQVTAGSPPKGYWVTMQDGKFGFDCPKSPNGPHEPPPRGVIPEAMGTPGDD